MAGGVVLSGSLGCTSLTANNGLRSTSTNLLIGSTQNDQGEHAVTAIDSTGKMAFQTPLRARGHGFAHHAEHNHLAVFARRPGQYVEIIDAFSGQQLTTIDATAERFFYGHGVYSADGRRLFVSEGVTETCEGVIGVYAAGSDYRKVGEIAIDGIGPHQIARLSGDRLVVAVGGIHTKGREKTNLDTMSPSLNYYHADGTFIERQSLEFSQLSIRHLDVATDDTVFFAVQYQDNDPLFEPLVWSHQLGKEPMPLSASATQWLDCKGYIGSVMTNKHSVIATSPVGNQMLEFDRGTLAIKRVIQIPDVCGVATNETQGFVSTGFGNVEQIQRGVMRTVHHSALKWDNHLICV